MITLHRIIWGIISATIFAAILGSTPDASAAAASSVNASGFSIVENGGPHAVIVTADAPTAVVEYAAQELQWHIKKATGMKLDVISETASIAPSATKLNRIYIGPGVASEKMGMGVDDLTPNSFRRKVTANALYLIGKDSDVKPPIEDAGSMGSLFAVYDWLEKQLSVKWLWPGEQGTVIPKTKSLFAGVPGSQKVLSPLIHSRARLNTWEGMDPQRKEKYVYDTSVWLRRQRFARGTSFQYGHAYGKYWERFSSSHPEYFAMRPDGKREPFNPKRPNLVQMCVSNAGLHQQIIKDWLIQRQERPELQWINGSENDKTALDPACTCEVCRLWDGKSPPALLVSENPWLSQREAARKLATGPKISHSDRYAKFWLALQKEGQKHDPDATVIGYAYADYSDPPIETKLNKNIIVGIVPAYNYPMTPQETAEFKKVWDGWAATGATLFLRPNNFLTGYDLPYVYAKQFGHDFKHALQNGLIATDFDSLIGMWGVQGINLYMMGRLTAHSELSVDEVLNEYYSAFGPAAGDIHKYFEFWEDVTSKVTTEFRRDAGGGWSPMSAAGDSFYTPETFAKGTELLQKAKSSAGANKEVLVRIDFLNLWLEHANLSMNVLAAFHKYKLNPADTQLKTNFGQARTILDAYRETHADKIINVGFLRYLERWRSVK